MAYTTPQTWVGASVVTAAQLNQQLRDNLMAGPTGTNITNLAASVGTPATGATGVLVSGGDYHAVVYDGTKWVSQTPVCLISNASGTINSATYTILARCIIPGWVNLFSMGLVPYFRCTGFVQAASGTETTTAAIAAQPVNNAAAEPSFTGAIQFGAVTSVTSTQYLTNSGWVTTSVGNGDVIEAVIQIKSSGTTTGKTQTGYSLWLRFQSV